MAANGQTKRGRAVGTVVAGLAGAAVGVTVAMFLSDKKKRDQLVKAIDTLRERSSELQEDALKKVQKAADLIMEKADELKDRADTVATSVVGEQKQVAGRKGGVAGKRKTGKRTNTRSQKKGQ